MRKAKIIAPALLSIAACGGIIAGSTYALFTSESKTNVAITSGKVNVTATVSGDLALSHKVYDDATGTYKEVEGTLFGGTAVLDEATQTISIDKMAPMDKVEFDIKVTNNSNVAIQYRAIIKCLEDDGLFDGLKVTIGDEEFNGTTTKTAYKQYGVGEGNQTIHVSIELPQSAGNDYQGKACKLQYCVEAVQGNAQTDLHVTKDNVQDYLDGKYGSIDGKTLILAEGEYDTLDLGRATKFEGSNTQYRINSFDSDAMTIDAFLAENPTGGSNQVPYYIRTLSDVTFMPEEGATVSIAGIKMASDKQTIDYAGAYDYVLGKQIVSGTQYDLALKVSNIKFENLTFTAKCNIEAHTNADETKSEPAVINGFTFDRCTFNINDTSDGNQAIRYYNQKGKHTVSNIDVEDCQFSNCFQGVYTQNVSDIKVNHCTFDTTGHNAVAAQADGGLAYNLGAVIVTNNEFKNIGDRIIRFNAVGANTQITIKNNVATNSGDSDGQVIKATSLAEGITYDISGNDWGEGRTVANTEFEDKIGN